MNVNGESNTSDTDLPFYIYEINKAFYKNLPITIEEIKPDKIEPVKFPSEYFTCITGSVYF